jgi:mannan endo-1,4-beta-mannosidase
MMALAAAEPANREANPTARAILNYLTELSRRTNGPRILSGQFSNFGQGANVRLLEKVKEKTDHWPALVGVDYADFGRGSLTFDGPNQLCRDYWNQGGLVTVSAHLYNPANPNGGGLRDKGVDLNDLLRAETETHKRWMHELDMLADGLKALKEAGVVVLWRPFHEMNGDWFWWGGQDPEKFIRVWRHMFDYFTKSKGLDNLLWVYGPNHGRRTAAYYAGDQYVDIVGLDAYTDFIDPEHIKGYDAVAALPKPFGFTEFGPFGPRNPPGDYDYRKFLAGIKAHFPKTCFFKCWNANWSLASNQFTKELLADSSIINREDMPAGLIKSIGK